MGQMLLWAHYCDWQHGVRGRGLGEQISSKDNDLKTWGLIITPASSQSEASIEVTWPDLTNQRPLRIILVNAPVPRPLTRLLLLWGKTKLICHNRSIRAIKRGMAKTLDYLSCFIEAAHFRISRMRTGNGRGGMGLLYSDYSCFNYCSPVIIWRWLYLVMVTKTSASSTSSWISNQISESINPWISLPPLLPGRPPKWICLLSITPGWDSYLYWEPPPCCVMNLKHSFNIFT